MLSLFWHEFLLSPSFQSLISAMGRKFAFPLLAGGGLFPVREGRQFFTFLSFPLSRRFLDVTSGGPAHPPPPLFTPATLPKEGICVLGLFFFRWVS